MAFVVMLSYIFYWIIGVHARIPQTVLVRRKLHEKADQLVIINL